MHRQDSSYPSPIPNVFEGASSPVNYAAALNEPMNLAWLQIKSIGVNVDENWKSILIDEAVRRSNKAERCGDDLIAAADPERPDGQMQRRRSTVYSDSVSCAHVSGELFLKFDKPRAQAKLARPQDSGYIFDFQISDVRTRKGHVHGVIPLFRMGARRSPSREVQIAAHAPPRILGRLHAIEQARRRNLRGPAKFR